MKKNVKPEGAYRNESISTQAVFCKNNQVYLKNSIENMNELEDWSPINFQWIPVIELHKKL